MEPLLSIRGLKKRYGAHTALDGIDLDLPQAEVFGLLGPNGAGKTSLIRIINRILEADEGHILFQGRPIEAADVRRIGYMPEERGLYQKMEVGEQAVYFARLKGMTEAAAKTALKEWFERFSIESWWKKKVEELSKGMAQKVQFIATVVHRPELIILDEPFSGFDPVNADLVKEEILRLSREGATILFSTHRMESVESLCSRIALIDRSKLVIQGPVGEVRKRYREHVYRLEWSAAAGGPEPHWPEGIEVLERAEIDPRHHRVRLRLPEGLSNSDVLRPVLEVGEPLFFEEVLPSIHEIFVRTVAGQIQPL
ncbi:ATP-binding cassette domain-containing protein [bacterium]|nr:ATP-binding cassette domain-containing protein [bacterium]